MAVSNSWIGSESTQAPSHSEADLLGIIRAFFAARVGLPAAHYAVRPIGVAFKIVQRHQKRDDEVDGG